MIARQRPIGYAPHEISALVNRAVVEQHAEEAAFQWLIRCQAVGAPHYSLKDLARQDERVEANLDGLLIAGEAGWDICEDALKFRGPGEVFAAAVLAFGNNIFHRMRLVLEIGCSEPKLQRALISALGWLPFQAAKDVIKGLFQSSDARICRVGIAAAAVHRKNPGPVLADCATDADSHLRARALRAAGELGRRDMQQLLQESLDDGDEACRFWAAWSAVRLGHRGAASFRVLRNKAECCGPWSAPALQITVSCLPLDRAKAWFRFLRSKEPTQRLAAQAAGAIGDPEFVPDLIAMMGEPALARVAGEALTTITGVDLAYEDLETDAPEGFEVGPTDNPADENVGLDPDLDLPWPKVSLVAEWWQQNRRRFAPGHRYLLGRMVTRESLFETLSEGKQRQRAAAALVLALSDPEAPMFEVRAPGKRQQELLVRWTS